MQFFFAAAAAPMQVVCSTCSILDSHILMRSNFKRHDNALAARALQDMALSMKPNGGLHDCAIIDGVTKVRGDFTKKWNVIFDLYILIYFTRINLVQSNGQQHFR